MQRVQCVNVSLIMSLSGQAEKSIIHRVNAKFNAGQMSLITGVTGAGKSTLLHILAGIIRPTEGEVIVDDEKVSRWMTYHRDRWRQKVGIIFQQPHLLNGLTVFENVSLPLIPRKMPLKTIRKKGFHALDSMGLFHMAGEKVTALSGGERQRVSAARAIVSGPELILADEPTAHQDMDNVKRLMDIFEHFKRKNTVVIVASHDPRLVESRRFDTCFMIENGALKKVQ